MAIEIRQVIEHIYDTDLIEKAVYYIENGFQGRTATEQYSKEVISRIVEDVEKILSTITKQITTAEVDVKENESQAREYFGKDFIQKFEEIRKKLSQENTTLYIHGTSIEIADIAMNNGFEARNPSITSTAVRQEDYKIIPEFMDYSKLMNWQHKESKGFVLIAVPNECTNRINPKPLWEYKPVPEGTELTSDTREYVIRSEFIIGTIDAIEKKITENPLYSNVHNLDGLILDDSVIVPKSNMKNAQTISKDTIEEMVDATTDIYENTTEYKKEESLVNKIDHIIDIIHEFYGNILALKENNSKILEIKSTELKRFKNVSADSIEKEKVHVEELIGRLKQIVPKLQSIEIDDTEIDDFINTATLSGINNISKKIKWLGKEPKKEIDWGNLDITTIDEEVDWN